MSLAPDFVKKKIANLKTLASNMRETVDSPTAETNGKYSQYMRTARLRPGPDVPMPKNVSVFFPEPDPKRGKVSIRQQDLADWMKALQRGLGCTLLSRRLLNFLCEHNTNNYQMSEACRLPAMSSATLFHRELNDDRVANDVQIIFREQCPAMVQSLTDDNDINSGRKTLTLHELLTQVINFETDQMDMTHLIAAWHDIHLRVQVVLKLMRALLNLQQARPSS